jgi:hypothetical protein
MCDQTLDDVIRASLDNKAFVSDDNSASDDEVDEKEMKDGLALDQDTKESAEYALSRVCVTLIQS